jgi:UDP-2,4-diacetamido-2,4,6-trideoxy-beta-L-altropyranose hydrolase
MGSGHVMRCLTLADTLAEAGAAITFAAAAITPALASRIEQRGYRLAHVPSSPELPRPVGKWEEPPLSDKVQRADANATGTAAGRADWAVVDHYLLDRCWHSAARDFAERILVIDDLANRSYDCDLLLDQTFGRSADDYRGLGPADAKVLAGSAYALLRPEFARERPAALERREAAAPVRRILVSMGTADAGGITAEIVEKALQVAPECAIDAVVASEAPSLDALGQLARSHPLLSVHVDTDQMAILMRDADIAVGAAGGTSWERCCLGLPSVVLVLADNQRKGAAELDAAGAAIAVTSADDLGPAISRLCRDSALRSRTSAAAFAIVDGQGVNRACDLLLERASPASELTLRPARADDSRNVWLWRNDYSTRSFSQTADPITWEDHKSWWDAALGSHDRYLLIAETDGPPIAVVRFDQMSEGGAEVSINVAPSARGSGLGGRILAEACRTFMAKRGAMPLHATIRRDNRASRRIFEGLGFKRSGALSDSSFERYELAP